MKLKNYENKFAFHIITILFLIFFLIFICYLIFNKHFCYITYTGVISNKDVIFMIKESDTKYFYHNPNLVNDSKIKKFTIKKIYKNILNKKNTKYNQIIVNFKFSKKYKDNDILNISLRKKKERHIDIFKIIWKEE